MYNAKKCIKWHCYWNVLRLNFENSFTTQILKGSNPLIFFLLIRRKNNVTHFCECIEMQTLWHQLYSFCNVSFSFSVSIPQRHINKNTENELLIDHLLLTFKIYVYCSRDIWFLNFAVLKVKTTNIRKIEEKIEKNYAHKNQEFRKRWNVPQLLWFL